MRAMLVLFTALFCSTAWAGDRNQLNIFDGERDRFVDVATNGDVVDPSLPTAVLMHGWNPPDDSNCGLFSFIDICEWDGDLNENNRGHEYWTRSFARRMLTRGSFNVFAWDALEEFNLDFFEAFDRISTSNERVGEARKLANELKMALPRGYNQNMHLFGYSLGAFLAGLATIELYVAREESDNRILTPEQLTLFDPANTVFVDGNIIFVQTNLSQFVTLARTHPEVTIHHSSMNGMYIEVYHGITNIGTHNANIYVDVPGSSHRVYRMYEQTFGMDPSVIYAARCDAPTVPGTIGFGASVLIAPQSDPAQNHIPQGVCEDQAPAFGRSVFCSNPFNVGVYTLRNCLSADAPTANAGPNQIIAVGASGTAEVRLDGSRSNDPNEEDLLSFSWSVHDTEIATGQCPTVELQAGAQVIELTVSDPIGNTSSDFVIIEVQMPFARGDSNIDGTVDVSDSIFTLLALFVCGHELPCPDAADVNNSDTVDVTDAIYGLTYIFQGGPHPSAPFPVVGLDTSADLLGCDEY